MIRVASGEQLRIARKVAFDLAGFGSFCAMHATLLPDTPGLPALRETAAYWGIDRMLISMSQSVRTTSGFASAVSPACTLSTGRFTASCAPRWRRGCRCCRTLRRASGTTWQNGAPLSKPSAEGRLQPRRRRPAGEVMIRARMGAAVGPRGYRLSPPRSPPSATSEPAASSPSRPHENGSRAHKRGFP